MSFGASKGEDGFALIHNKKVKIVNIRSADMLCRHQRVILALRICNLDESANVSIRE